MNSPILHYHKTLLPLISALDPKQAHELFEALSEMDYLIETLSYSELEANEQEETELAYWAWWEKIRHQLGA